VEPDPDDGPPLPGIALGFPDGTPLAPPEPEPPAPDEPLPPACATCNGAFAESALT
jgi:hypothetical protein